MRRSRQGRIINWAIIFVVYCSIQVYSATSKATSKSTLREDDELTEYENEFSSTMQPTGQTEYSSTISSPDSTAADGTKPSLDDLAHPTWRRLRNCTPPAIEQFPKAFPPPSWRIHGGVIVNIIIALFTFFGLAIVCDDYFVSSLDRICEGNNFIDIQSLVNKFHQNIPLQNLNFHLT